MLDRRLRVVAVLVAAATLLLAVAGATLRTLGAATPQSFNISTPFVFWVVAATSAIYSIVGVVLAQRLPRHPVPWLFTGIGLSLGGVIFSWAYAVVASSTQPPLSGVPLAALVNAAILQPIGLTLGVILLFVFPDGPPIDVKSRRVASIGPLAGVLLGLGVALTPGSIGIFAGLDSPLAVHGSAFVGRSLATAGVIAIVLLSAVGFRSLLRRYRTADDTTQRQIRWFLWAGSVGVVAAGTSAAVITITPDVLTGPREAVVLVLFSLAASLAPIACGISILRYRLYDIDQLISRTFVYGSLLALVAGAYSAGLTALERILIALTGQPSDFGIVLTTLLLAVSFEPIRRRLERFADTFKESTPPVASVAPMPSEAWVESVAARVIELMKSDQAAATTAVVAAQEQVERQSQEAKIP